MADRFGLPPLPDGTRVLHIGPHKTGTTTIQAAFHQNRDLLAQYGVRYTGRGSQPMTAAMAAARGADLAGSRPGAGEERWRTLVEEIRSAPERAVVTSSEFFCEAQPDRVRAIVDAITPEADPALVQVVITLRPLVRILASQWQQYMQNRPGLRYDDALGYEGWLDLVLHADGDTELTPSFWRRHRHDRLVSRWAEVVGPERVTVIVVDESDKFMLPAVFEELLALPERTLVPRQIGANRSLTVPEVETLRAFNSAWIERDWSVADYTKLVRFGAIRHLQTRDPQPGEPRLLTPPWAVDRAARIGAEAAARIRTTGVRVVGDLDVLGDPSVARDVGENPTDVVVPQEIPARFAAGAVKLLAEIPARPAPPDREAGSIELALRQDRIERRALAARKRNRAVLASARDQAPVAADVSVLALARTLAGRARRRWRRGR